MAGSGTAHLRDGSDPLLRVEHLVVEFGAGMGRKVHAVSDVSFDVLRGETLGLVGESGCGKSTTARAVIQMIRPTSGQVNFDGAEMTKLSHKQGGRPPTTAERAERVREIFEVVGLDFDSARGRFPHQYSGGQCQRISIARALVLEPKLLICDEPVSALDVSVQAQILNLLEDLKARYGLTLIFIAHDLAVVKNVSDRIAVMYLGKVCEVARADDLYAHATHPYTNMLLASIPEPNPDARPSTAYRARGEFPSPVTPPSGCRFRTRCPRAQPVCAQEEPVIRPTGMDHYVACHFPVETPVTLTPSAAASNAS
jgi:peptide/nickel transport system ATP-binding protein